MPTTIGILTPTGLQAASYSADNLNDAAHHEPAGIYTVARTYNRAFVLKFDAHLDRMEESAQLENMTLQLDRAVLRAALRTLIDRSGYAESRFRITVPHAQPNLFIITLEPFSGVPAAIKNDGVAVVTVNISRDHPQAKDTTWIAKREAAKTNVPPAYEYLIVNKQDQLLEGFGSNFYAILENTLWTAPDGTVLGGISRQIILDIAPTVFPVQQKPITLMQIPRLRGAFLTSSSRGVIPIVKIDDHVVGDGQPDVAVQDLSARYDAWVTHHIEAI